MELVPSWSCSKAVYKPVWHIPLPSVQWIYSWWWTDELSETCRVSWPNKFVKLVHLVGFITKKFVTMHGHMNVNKKKMEKYFLCPQIKIWCRQLNYFFTDKLWQKIQKNILFSNVQVSWQLRCARYTTKDAKLTVVESSWNVMAHGDAREGKWMGNWWMEWVASILHTTSEHGVSSITTITTADAHTSPASSQLNWRPPPI